MITRILHPYGMILHYMQASNKLHTLLKEEFKALAMMSYCPGLGAGLSVAFNTPPSSQLKLRIPQSKPTSWRYGGGAFGVCLLQRPLSHHVARGEASPFGTETTFLATESGVSPRVTASCTASKSVTTCRADK
jgi:hypothetical protein